MHSPGWACNAIDCNIILLKGILCRIQPRIYLLIDLWQFCAFFWNAEYDSGTLTLFSCITYKCLKSNKAIKGKRKGQQGQKFEYKIVSRASACGVNPRIESKSQYSSKKRKRRVIVSIKNLRLNCFQKRETKRYLFKNQIITPNKIKCFSNVKANNACGFLSVKYYYDF